MREGREEGQGCGGSEEVHLGSGRLVGVDMIKGKGAEVLWHRR